MRDLLSKAGLLLPYIFAAVQTLTTPIRREPFLLTQDSINFTDPLGESYTLQYEFFKHWSVSNEPSRERSLHQYLPRCAS
jgi:hypothetical protein